MSTFIAQLENESGDCVSWSGEALDSTHAADLALEHHDGYTVIDVEEEG